MTQVRPTDHVYLGINEMIDDIMEDVMNDETAFKIKYNLAERYMRPGNDPQSVLYSLHGIIKTFSNRRAFATTVQFSGLSKEQLLSESPPLQFLMALMRLGDPNSEA